VAAKRNESAGSPSDEADREIVMTRVVSAPRELVYQAFTDPAHVALWWGPNGFTNTIHEMDVRPGGGTDYPNKIVYLEVVKPERLVYNHGDDGTDVDQYAFHVTVTFGDLGDKTKVTMRSLFPTKEARDQVIREFGALEGGSQTLNLLEEHLKTM
jgi:uncharacterized protein YndB with AHSA1/START domain